MFTGIIECLGKVTFTEHQQHNLYLTIESPISHQLKTDQSVSHHGVCLTVVQVNNHTHSVVAIAETLKKTNLGALKQGDFVNLERCMPANGRFDGHIVQGHVDTVAKVASIQNQNGSWLYTFTFDTNEATQLMVEKGSICVNGVSLTVVEVWQNGFSVAIIPYTFEHTTFKYLQTGDEVNIEYDILGKYMAKLVAKK